MSLFKQFGTNKAKEIEGVEIQYGANADGSIPSFRIARMGKSNKRYTKALEKATRPHRRAIELGTMNDEHAEAIFMRVFTDTVLLGWSNVQDADGKEIAFTQSNACQLFTELPDLYEDLQAQAGRAATFRDEQVENEAGN